MSVFSKLREFRPSRDMLAPAAVILVAVATFAFAVAPLFVSRDLPLVDLPNHLGAVSVWNHYGDARFGLQAHYELDIRPDPYFAYYGFLHVASYVMPLRLASKLYILLGMVGLVFALRSLLRALDRPTIMALGALPLAWHYAVTRGFVAFGVSLAAIFYSCTLLVRLEKSDAPEHWHPVLRTICPWSWQLLAANIVMGMGVYLMHILAWLIWVPLVFLFTRWRAPIFILPSAYLLSQQSDMPSGKAAATLTAIWTYPFGQVSGNFGRFGDLVFTYMTDIDRWLLAILAVSVVAATVFILRKERKPDIDWRPLKMFAVFLCLYLFWPFSLHQPLYWTNINVRVAVVVVLGAFVCVPRGQLSGWRALAVTVPFLVVSVIYNGNAASRFAAFDESLDDFYEIVETLPYNPDVIVKIHDDTNPVAAGVWRYYSAYVQVERGGRDTTGWKRGFPAKRRDGHAAIRSAHLSLERQRKGALPNKPGHRVVMKRGQWVLFEQLTVPPKAVHKVSPSPPDDGGEDAARAPPSPATNREPAKPKP